MNCLPSYFNILIRDAMRKVIWPSVIVLRFVIGVLIGFACSSYVFQSHPKILSNCDEIALDTFNVLRIPKPKKSNLLFVGVMTADKFLETRAKAVYETWGQSLSGNIIFFSSENSSSKTEIPLVKVLNVDDSYPPQKKSLEMLKYMYQHYPYYDFYLRADDDLYVRIEKLQKFLSSVNSSEPLLIGHPGYGTKEERPSLHLIKDQPFCMGGPGIIISNEALKLFSKNIDNCDHLFKTTHEDVEFWRCMNHYVGISCTKSDEVSKYFYNRKDLQKVFNVPIHQKDVANTLTLHPLKNHLQLYKLHLALQTIQIQEKEYDIHCAMQEMKMVEQQLLKDAGNKVTSAKGRTDIDGSEISSMGNLDKAEWNIYLAGTYYTANHIYDHSSFKNSSMSAAQEDLESYLLSSVYKQKLNSEFYVKNLPGVGTEFIYEMKIPNMEVKLKKYRSKTWRKNYFPKFSKYQRKRYYVQIPYGTLIVREMEDHSLLESLPGW